MLSVDRLRVERGGVEVLHGVDLQVRAGEICALIGSNGAGKTTLLRAIAGLEPISGGAVHYDGRPLAGLPGFAVARLGVGFVPAERRLFGGLSVRDNLALGAYPDRATADRFEEVFVLFPRLANRRAQPAGTLSGGEQQMLAIGRALMGRPRLLVLDEPSTGLAPPVVAELYDIVARIGASSDHGLLIAEQRVATVLARADRGYVLEDGAVRLSGDAAHLTGHPEVRRAYLGYG